VTPLYDLDPASIEPSRPWATVAPLYGLRPGLVASGDNRQMGHGLVEVSERVQPQAAHIEGRRMIGLRVSPSPIVMREKDP